MFEIHTYAAPTDYVSDFRDNRARWKKGEGFFHSKILPLNDAEFSEIKKAHEGADDPKAADLHVLATRLVGLFNLKITCNDGSVLIPKNGKDLIDARKKLDAQTFAELASDHVRAAVNHSKLAEGELKGSGSSSE